MSEGFPIPACGGSGPASKISESMTWKFSVSLSEILAGLFIVQMESVLSGQVNGLG